MPSRKRQRQRRQRRRQATTVLVVTAIFRATTETATAFVPFSSSSSSSLLTTTTTTTKEHDDWPLSFNTTIPPVSSSHHSDLLLDNNESSSLLLLLTEDNKSNKNTTRVVGSSSSSLHFLKQPAKDTTTTTTSKDDEQDEDDDELYYYFLRPHHHHQNDFPGWKTTVTTTTTTTQATEFHTTTTPPPPIVNDTQPPPPPLQTNVIQQQQQNKKKDEKNYYFAFFRRCRFAVFEWWRHNNNNNNNNKKKKDTQKQQQKGLLSSVLARAPYDSFVEEEEDDDDDDDDDHTVAVLHPTTTTTTTTTTPLLNDNNKNKKNNKKKKRQYSARTLTGLIHALAEEVTELTVRVDTTDTTPFWRKKVHAVRIQFGTLAFRPLRIRGGPPPTTTTTTTTTKTTTTSTEQEQQQTTKPWWRLGRRNNNNNNNNNNKRNKIKETPDEAFDRIDADKSGALDRDELAHALMTEVTGHHDRSWRIPFVRKMADELVRLYDFNGDGVVDRQEYRSLVRDMAALRLEKPAGVESSTRDDDDDDDDDDIIDDDDKDERSDWVAPFNSTESMEVEEIDDNNGLDSLASSLGSITISNLKVDLRRLLFGAVPILKRIIPGGPLVLEPFKVSVDGSFSREDILASPLLDAGLRQLVGRVLRRRVGSLRDVWEGAMFKGRSFKLISGTGPVVTVPKLTNVEFDAQNRLVVTGRAHVRHRPDGPAIENAFKVRTKIGTRKNGRVIRLVEPELALVLECPESFETSWAKVSQAFGLPKPERPAPIYSFFPIYSPFKVDDDKDGFDLGEDNTIESIYIKNSALCFTLSAVLRPGRFLGSHYIAFTVPIRTFIVTLDRVRAGIRAARKAKKAAQTDPRRTRLEQAIDIELSRQQRQQEATNRLQQVVCGGGGGVDKSRKSFFSRFVDGYLQVERQTYEKEQLTGDIQDFFGRQQLLHETTTQVLTPTSTTTSVVEK